MTNDPFSSLFDDLEDQDRKECKVDQEEKLFLHGGSDAKDVVQIYIQDTWQRCANSLKPSCYSAVASNSTHVFVVDGWDLRAHIQVYDIEHDTWTLIENILKGPREGATATIIKNKLYVSCGRGVDEDCLSSTEVLAINGSSCTPCDHGVPDLKEARWAHASVTIDDEVLLYWWDDITFRGVIVL